MAYNTARATLAAMWVNQFVADQTAKDVCLVALESVGKLAWANGMVQFSNLLPGNKLNTQRLGCVCYEAPVAFALMANALSIHEANVFYGLATQPNGNAQAVQHMYTRLGNNISRWQTGDGPIPAGAMVFHGDTGTPCRHVTFSIGNGDVVSCWGAGQAQLGIGGGAGLRSDAFKVFVKQVDDLMAKNLSPDTVVVPATAFTDLSIPAVRLHYTNGPFWTFW